jgi:hypothetical protein
MKRYSPTGRRNHGRTLKRLLDTWHRKGSTGGPTPWQIYNDDDGIKYWICHICAKYVGLREKNQTIFPIVPLNVKNVQTKSKKPSRLDGSHRKEFIKVPLAPSERAKAYRQRKELRVLDQPSKSADAFAINPDDETAAAPETVCSTRESDIKIVDLPEVYDV